MKVTFQGDSLHEIHQQIITEAEFLVKPKANGKPVSTMTVTTPKQHMTNEVAAVTAPHVKAMQDSMDDDHHPEVQGAPTTKQSKIDGYNVSDGKVWVPVPGRSSAFTGVEVDEYHKRKSTTGELDSKGTPWDPAIHTSTKAKKNDGTWKNRPGGGSSVKTEQPSLKQEPVEEVKPATVQEVVAHEDSQPAIGRAPSMHNYDSFKANLMTIVVKLINENKITRDYMKDLNAYFQVSNLWDVKNDEEKCQQLFRLFIDYQFIMGA
jgi:hypothetical protein